MKGFSPGTQRNLLVSIKICWTAELAIESTYLKSVLFTVDFNIAIHKFDSDRVEVVLVVAIRDKAIHETGFANSSVAKNNDLEQDGLVGRTHVSHFDVAPLNQLKAHLNQLNNSSLCK